MEIVRFGGIGESFGPPPLFMFIFILFAALIAGTILFQIGKGVSAWSRNNASPIQNQEARIVSRRTKVWGGSNDSSASTSYYVTFELTDRSRLELSVKGGEYGLLAEGDTGILSYQGTRYLGFRRS